MRLSWSLAAVAVSASSIAAFAPGQNRAPVVARASSALQQVVASADVKAKNEATLEKLKAKDAGSHAITKDVSFVGCFVSCERWFMGKFLLFIMGPTLNDALSGQKSFHSISSNC